VDKGFVLLDTPREVAESSTVEVSMVPDTKAVRAVAE
jgi:hypothetical protein